MNKKVVMIIGIVLLVAGATYAASVVFFAGDSHSDLNDGLVLDIDLTQDNYVAGTKTFADDSGQGNNGVSANAATFTTDKYGKSTGAMSFNGASDYVQGSAINPQYLTISAWVKWNNFFPGNGGYAIVSNSNTATNGYLLYQATGPPYNRVITFVYTTSIAGIQSTTLLNTGTWYHLALTYNGSNISFYLNGVLDNSTNQTGTIKPSTNPFLIGSTYSTGGAKFNGSISEVKIWNRALSATEVKALYNSSKPKMTASSIETGLIGYWPLDSASEVMGNNLVSNSGTVGTTDWVDSNTDGLADSWSMLTYGTPSIVTGNGFSGNAQRMYMGENGNGVLFANLALTAGKTYRVTYLYRSNNGIAPYVWDGATGGAYSILTNTGNALRASFTFTSTSSAGGTLRFYVRSSVGNGQTGDYIEIDEVSVKEIKTADKTPYENHGEELNGVSLTTDRMGHTNGAMDFHGVHDRIRANPIYLNQNNFSVFAWVYKKGAINSFAPFVEQGGTTRFRLIDYAGKLCFGNDSITDNFYCTSLNILAENGNWYFIGAVVENRVIKIYVNAINLSYSQSAGMYGPTGESFLFIGDRDYTGAVNAWNGSIADVRIYNRTLSPTEIKTLYNSYDTKVASDSLQKGLILDMPLTSSWTKGGAAGSQIMTDKTPYSNDGQNYGATVGSSYTGFDGNDYINISQTSSLQLNGNITIMAWVKDGGSSSHGIVEKMKSSPYTGYGIAKQENLFKFWTTNGNGSYSYTNSNSYYTDSNWHHVVGVRRNGTNYLYVDGIQQTDSDTFGLEDSGQNLVIGRYYSDVNDYYFTGSISNVRVYNRSLSDSEIKLLYARGR
jgi:hypothetical protein